MVPKSRKTITTILKDWYKPLKMKFFNFFETRLKHNKQYHHAAIDFQERM